MRFLSRRRAGVSSIVGSIFFVLIMVVAIASLVTIFNSFSSYNNAVNKASNANVQASDTELSITGSTFGSFPPSTTSNFNVDTACAATATATTNQNKLFFAAGMWWDFYTCDSLFQYSTSFDGVTWESGASIPNLVAGYTVGPYSDIQVIGSTMWLVIAKDGSPDFQFAEGTLAAGGTYSAPAGTITWTSSPAQLTTTANTLGPIQLAEDGAGNEWVAVVQTGATTAIAIYEHEACATAANTGWENAVGNACSNSNAPGNYAPTGGATRPNLGTLTADANMILFAPPSTLGVTTGAILLYESGSTGTLFGGLTVITQSSLQTTTWSTGVTLTLTHSYSLPSSSAVMVGSTLYFAGLAGAAGGGPTGTLDFWTLPFTSMTAGANTAEKAIEGTAQAWMAALTYTGNTLALFDAYPTAAVIQYYTSSTLGSIWNSPAIPLESSETAVNGLSPASGAFAVTWSNTANNVRFAALSTVTVTNSTPFSVHVVDLYVYESATNTLYAHYYFNSTEDFDYWIGQGSTTTIPVEFIWAATSSYLFTIGTDTGVTAQLTSTSPPVTSTTCSSGQFLTEISPALTCAGADAASSPAVAFTSNANTCTDTTSGTSLMMGLGVSYTTSASSSGGIYVVLAFDDKSPAVSNINSKWQLAYGTGAAPACNAAATGTLTGQQYTFNIEAAVVRETSQSVGVTITGLSANTAYWFDVQALDSSAAAWVYSLPSLSVTDILTSVEQVPQLGYSSNTNTCTISSAATEMGGFGTTYTTGSASTFSGNLYLTLTMDVKSPATTTINSQWRIAYGTGAAPACAAASTGTAVGNQYAVTTEAAVVLETGQSESVVIPNLAASTTYWFDVQVTDSTAGSWIYSNPTLAVAQMPTAVNLPPNVNFDSDANSCGRNTGANAMAGFGTTYTTLSSSTGSIFAALTFKVATPATANLNSKWQVVYGTGAPPACNAAATGTTIGSQYAINTEAAVVGGMGHTIGFVLTGLVRGTQYWFDVQVTDSSAAVWTYSNPALSVMDIMPADFVHSNTEFTSNANTCGRNTATNLMAGFATSYTTTSFGAGNVQVALTFNVIYPTTNTLTSIWRVSYGTGAAPACNGAAVGTTVGNQYTLESSIGNGAPAALEVAQSEGITIVGLTPGTTYWFDLQVTDSSAVVWTYSNAQISVVELP